MRLAILGRRPPAVRPCCVPPRPAPTLLPTDAVPEPDAQLDGIEFGNPVMIERQSDVRAIKMAKDRPFLPAALGVGIHPNDNNGFTWQGTAALIAQDDALRAVVA